MGITTDSTSGARLELESMDYELGDAMPDVFCWTKMGAESGQQLDSILRRKEWERQLGNGRFYWGIGHSIERSLLAAAKTTGELEVIFSPMISSAKEIDASPQGIQVWHGWEDSDGVTKLLPPHVLVTSRAHVSNGIKKRNHYALVCNSGRPLRPSNLLIRPLGLRNFGTSNPIGFSQVTSVVSATARNNDGGQQGYRVAGRAALISPFSVKLALPSILDRTTIEDIDYVSGKGDVRSWEALVRSIRAEFGAFRESEKRQSQLF